MEAAATFRRINLQGRIPALSDLLTPFRIHLFVDATKDAVPLSIGDMRHAQLALFQQLHMLQRSVFAAASSQTAEASQREWLAELASEADLHGVPPGLLWHGLCIVVCMID